MASGPRPQLRVGRSLFAVLAALNAEAEPVTAAALRSATGLPRSNVSTALVALADVDDLLSVTRHPTATYATADGPMRCLQYQLTELGRRWFAGVVVERARRPDRSFTGIALPGASLTPI